MDVTEAGTPEAGGQLSGEATRNAVIRRLKKGQNVPNYTPKLHAGASSPPGTAPIPKS